MAHSSRSLVLVALVLSPALAAAPQGNPESIRSYITREYSNVHKVLAQDFMDNAVSDGIVSSVADRILAKQIFFALRKDKAAGRGALRFDIDRKPNRHIAFGHGEHFCMGAHLARRSQRAIVEELARRIDQWEIIGEPEWISAGFVVGLKRLPVRYRIRKS